MGIFNRYLNPGKGVRKKDVTEKFGFRRFFASFGDKFWRLAVLNLLFFLVNCPFFAIFARLAGVGGIPYQTPTSVLFQPLHGVMLHGENPALHALYGVVGVQIEHGYPSTWSHVLTAIALLSLVTFGLANVGLTYCQRNFIRREPVDVLEDFFHSIKRNFKQGLLLGLVDLGILFVIAYALVFYVYSVQSFGLLLMFYLTAFISVLYLLARPYMYLMCVTFDLKTFKILKNACILTVSGLLRNVFCSFFALLMLVLNVVVFALIPSLGVGMLFIFTVSLAWFFQLYGAWPVIKRHMIDPFYEETPVSDVKEETEAVFEDRG